MPLTPPTIMEYLGIIEELGTKPLPTNPVDFSSHCRNAAYALIGAAQLMDKYTTGETPCPEVDQPLVYAMQSPSSVQPSTPSVP